MTIEVTNPQQAGLPGGRSAPSNSHQRRRRRDESGLTTLEWLLIVAAVAGIAALAVVLVQNVVGDTSEQISGSSAGKTAAQIAAQQIIDEADRDAAGQPVGAKKYGEWKVYYAARCNRLSITYSDAGIKVQPTFESAGANGMDANDVVAANIMVALSTAGAPSTGSLNGAVAHCGIS